MKNTASDTILFVDDDVRVVSALQRSLYRDYRIEIAARPEDALDAIAQTDYAVVISDLKMPGMNGIELLTTVKEVAPNTVRVLLTGQADLDAAIAAVNDGNIFRFLTKPCPQELLKKAIDAALEQHWLQVSEKDVLRETLMGTVAVLMQILSSLHPMAFGRASRIRNHVKRLAAELRLPDSWEFEAAALLSQIGWISVDASTVSKYYAGSPLDLEETSQVLAQASAGQNMLHKIPRLYTVSRIIGRQSQDFEPQKGTDVGEYMIAIGGQMLRAAIDFDRLAGADAESAIARMLLKKSDYNPEVISALYSVRKDLELPGDGTLSCGGAAGTQGSEQEAYRHISDQVLHAIRQERVAIS
jgi:response regulator RpfG family c-di-GMP phosphodiesterase